MTTPERVLEAALAEHNDHATSPESHCGTECFRYLLAHQPLRDALTRGLAGSGVVEAGGPHDPDDGDCRCLRCWYDASDLPMQPATPPETLAGSGECGFVRDGFRCNDTPIQHRYVCGVLHGHTMVCHPFQPATPPTPALTAARLALDAVAAERQRQDAKWGEQNHDLTVWMTVLGEEFGETCHASLHYRAAAGRAENVEGDTDPDGWLAKVRNEAVQTAAVAVAIVEFIDRGMQPTAATEEATR